uniref:Uncharacterized protein n=1 Tax=Rhipicephalus microplus TaxID=6941 RepID=A0A6M2CKI0_RHIMP
MESRRRCWIGHEHQSSYSPKSCVSNLTSNEWCRCRHDAHQGDFFRAHTLLLIVQVFLLAIAGVPTSCNVCLGPSATNASSDTRPQSRSTFTPGMLDTPLQDLRMSVMSCTMDSIKALPQNYYTSGHGEAAATMPLTKEFVLAVQVSCSFSTIMSGDELFLLVLPCPGACLSIAYDCYVALAILIWGDVESNPGPSTADILQNVLKGQADIHAEVTQMKNRFSECVQLIRDLDSCLKSLEQLMKE